ncbi:hypothetical protein FXV91_09035 [Methanosarcina sp. DH2]|uniref:hypothetical protein n=1 Tax=Methanosarcina sp. DH2 TaxID=2605639 RepID=UPI001E3789F1|nr:hypothetical protein [Methanosarcina sp. DH2]MCC4770330.1 hypothetical protein [Methanosarcina sp. DH2]
MILDENSDVRGGAAKAIGAAFSHLPDKQQAWNDLHELTYDDSEYREYVNWDIASAIGTAFLCLPDKEQAWNDLCRLAIDECCEARQKAIEVLGFAFIHVPNKQKALNDIYELTKYGDEEDSDITTYAYHSLGNISLFKASQCKDVEEYKRELEQAIGFFKKAGQTNWCENPSRFNLCLFGALHTMLFNKQGANEDLNEYLACIKSITQYLRADQCKKLLREAIENLATASKQVQYLENKDFKTTENELKFYRKYFDHAEELLRDTEEKLPLVTGVIRKGMPILDKNLKKTLSDHVERS